VIIDKATDLLKGAEHWCKKLFAHPSGMRELVALAVTLPLLSLIFFRVHVLDDPSHPVWLSKVNVA